MKSDPVSPQGRHAVTVGDVALTLETPPDLDALLDQAAANNPQAVDEIPYYAILWPAAHGLARYLWEHRSEIRCQRVIELGCGLGLPSILAARLGAHVLATDFHPGTGKWFLHNAGLNHADVTYMPLDWNALMNAAPGPRYTPAPFVIGSDLLYEKRHIPALVCAVNALCAPGGRVIIADPGRDNLGLFVFSMEKTGWRHTLHAEGDIYICCFGRGPESHQD